jgi:hypothetical protein
MKKVAQDNNISDDRAKIKLIGKPETPKFTSSKQVGSTDYKSSKEINMSSFAKGRKISATSKF